MAEGVRLAGAAGTKAVHGLFFCCLQPSRFLVASLPLHMLPPADLQASAGIFKQQAKSLKSKMWWKNLKMKLCIAFAVLLVVGVITVRTPCYHIRGQRRPCLAERARDCARRGSAQGFQRRPLELLRRLFLTASRPLFAFKVIIMAQVGAFDQTDDGDDNKNKNKGNDSADTTTTTETTTTTRRLLEAMGAAMAHARL